MMVKRYQIHLMLLIGFGVDAKKAVVFIGDDAGFESSVYGNKLIKTPGLQKLADRGLVFENAFTVVSSCSSSRATIMTGLPPHQNGAQAKNVKQRVNKTLCLTFLACAQLDGANEAIEEIDVDQDAENGYASDNSVEM